MDAIFQLIGERFVDGAMLRDARQSVEPRGRDADTEVGLAFWSRTSVTFMSGAFVDHFKMVWKEFGRKFCDNRIPNRHKGNPLGQ